MTKIFPSEQFCTQNVFSFNLVVTENALVINLSVAGTQPVIYSVSRIQTKLNCTKANIRLLVLCKRKKKLHTAMQRKRGKGPTFMYFTVWIRRRMASGIKNTITFIKILARRNEIWCKYKGWLP